MSVLDAIARARLGELQQFFSLPPDHVAGWLMHIGVPAERLWEALQLMSPADLGAEAPKSWRLEERGGFALLPGIVQQAIRRRETDRDKYTERKASEAARLHEDLQRLRKLVAPVSETTTKGANKEDIKHGEEISRAL
jgi:hypothetical protein